jgi:hypothetical protein
MVHRKQVVHFMFTGSGPTQVKLSSNLSHRLMFIFILLDVHQELIQRRIDPTSHTKFNQNLQSTLGNKTYVTICIEL